MKTPNLRDCDACGVPLLGKRPDARFCSDRCQKHGHHRRLTERTCKQCPRVFPIKDRSDHNRKYCSSACAKKAHQKSVRAWKHNRPGYMREYNETRVAKNPGVWVDRSRQNRLDSIALLGSECIVCRVTNPNWLHIDYIPTTRGTPYRHPRGIAYIRRHREQFRLLCANHHYELTLTGKIEGTDIVQLPHLLVRTQNEQSKALLAPASEKREEKAA